MNTAVLFSTGKDDWQTPPAVLAPIIREFGINLDVAANAHTARCEHFLGGPEYPDALAVDWSACRPFGDWPICWCNPPYSRGLQHKFIAKAAEQRLRGVTTVMLIPARTDTKAFHAHIWDADRHQPRPGVEVRFLKGRIKFVGAPHGAPFPSMIVIFRGSPVGPSPDVWLETR